MKNKNVGYLIVALSVVIGIIVLIFNLGLKSIVEDTCTHGSSCVMYDTIAIQTYVSLGVAGLILAIGLFFVFTKESERIIIRKLKAKKKKFDLSKLDKNEKKVVNTLINENRAMFQRTLMEQLGIGKVGMTRLLDKLEAKQFIERKRRGMNNIIVLKN